MAKKVSVRVGLATKKTKPAPKTKATKKAAKTKATKKTKPKGRSY